MEFLALELEAVPLLDLSTGQAFPLSQLDHRQEGVELRNQPIGQAFPLSQVDH